MSVFGTDLNQYFAPTQAFYEDLKLKTQQTGEENLAKTKQEIEAKQNMQQNPSSSGSNTMLWVIVGISAVALITLAVLKRKKII